ncbi:DUF6703 family protein [Asanoa sp. NPDC050611]|uniref:DUF6703 family protein n=1 Tax=Asanoa sp. NPDC050611 TaxID=3157098 RepID=UPI00340CFE0C
MQPTQPGLSQRLARVNPTKAFLGALALILLGLFLPGIIGGLVLLLLAAAMIALTRMTWSVQAPQTRLVRLVLLAVLIGIAVFKIL